MNDLRDTKKAFAKTAGVLKHPGGFRFTLS